MVLRLIQRVSVVAIIAIVAGGVVSARTASNVVPTSHAWKTTQSITANTIKPAACASITIADMYIGSGTVSGSTSANDLILGSSGNDTLGDTTGGSADKDCCKGGGGSDTYKVSCTVHA